MGADHGQVPILIRILVECDDLNVTHYLLFILQKADIPGIPGYPLKNYMVECDVLDVTKMEKELLIVGYTR